MVDCQTITATGIPSVEQEKVIWWEAIPLTIVTVDAAVILFLWKKARHDMEDEFHEVKDESRVTVRPRDIFLYGLAGMAAGMMQAGMPLEHAWLFLYRQHGDGTKDGPAMVLGADDLMLEAQTAVRHLNAIIDEHGGGKVDG